MDARRASEQEGAPANRSNWGYVAPKSELDGGKASWKKVADVDDQVTDVDPAPQTSAARGDAPPAPPASAPSGSAVSSGQVAYLRNKMKAAGVDEGSILQRFGVASLEAFTTSQFDELKSELLAVV